MIKAVRAQAGNDVAWIVSTDAKRMADYANEHGIEHASTELSDALSDLSVSAVYISSTNEKHHDQALAAIAAGKHVLCEKPLALTIAEAAEMVKVAAEAGVTFATNHHLRCSGSHRCMRNLIKEGRIGRPLSLRIHHAVHLPENLQHWRIDAPGKGGGVILDITVHDADVARFLLDEDPQTVVAQMTVSGMGKGVEDSAMSVWTMPSGAMVMSHESFTHPFAGTSLEAHGTEGSVFARDVMTQKAIGNITLVTSSGTEEIDFPDRDLYVQGVADFISATQNAGKPAASGEDGVKSLAVAMAVLEAAETGRRIDVDYSALG